MAESMEKELQLGEHPPTNKEDSVFVHDSEAVWEQRKPYGPSGFAGLFVNSYAAMCAVFAALGGLVFGYDQGVGTRSRFSRCFRSQTEKRQ